MIKFKFLFTGKKEFVGDKLAYVFDDKNVNSLSNLKREGKGQFCKKGDILIVNDNYTNYIKGIALVDYDGCYLYNYYRYSPVDNCQIFSKLYYYFLKMIIETNNITVEQLPELTLPVLNYENQKLIANKVEAKYIIELDYISNLKKQKEYLKKLAQFEIDDYFKSIKSNEECSEYKLGDICTFIKNGYSKSFDYAPFSNYQVISAENIKNSELDLSLKKYIDKNTFELFTRIRQIENGDILMTKIGSNIGNVAVVTQNVSNLAITHSLFHIRTTIDSQYVYYFCLSSYFKAQINRLFRTNERAIMSIDQLSNANIPYFIDADYTIFGLDNKLKTIRSLNANVDKKINIIKQAKYAYMLSSISKYI